jgi:hypothetical protein
MQKMFEVVALSLTYCPVGFDNPPTLPWRVSGLTSKATGKIVALFASEEDAVKFVYDKPFLLSGIMSVPPKWRYLFEAELDDKRQYGIECARMAKRMYAAGETTLDG